MSFETQSRARQSRRSSRPAGVKTYSQRGGDPTNSWVKFLAEAQQDQPALCHVLAKFSEPLEGAKSEDEAPMNLAGFPWLTPVLGSGCLSSPDATQKAQLLALPAELSGAFGAEALPDGTLKSDEVYEFTSSLLRTRVPELSGHDFPHSSSAAPTRESLQVAKAILAARLLARAWHEAVAASPSFRRKRDSLSFSPGSIAGLRTKAAVIAPAVEMLKDVLAAQQQLAEGPVKRILQAARVPLEQIAERARSAESLTGQDVDALLEVAWLLLISRAEMYPGWRDLMASAALDVLGADSDRRVDFSRPLISSVQPDLAVSIEALRSATIRSWRDRETARSEFYDSVVEVLQAESEFGDANGPMPAALVTSIDLELELALARVDQQFTVLVPYYLTYSSSEKQVPRAMLFWLAATIKHPREYFGALIASFSASGSAESGSATKPDEQEVMPELEWRVATGNVNRTIDGIVVARLVGSPLFTPATMDSPHHVSIVDKDGILRLVPARNGGTVVDELAHLAGSTFRGEYPHLDLVPALLLDEYSGMHHLAAAAHGSLPANLVELEESTVFRYWAAVGVQVNDPLLRLVLASHVNSNDAARSKIEHHGVLVNRNVRDADGELMAWQGFDAVQAPFEAVVTSLKHYAAHLRSESPEPAKSFVSGAKCKVGGDVQ